MRNFRFHFTKFLKKCILLTLSNSVKEAIMKEQLKKFLKNFQMLTNDEIQLIMDRSIIKFFEKGTYLLREGQIATECYLVLKGCVRVYYLIDGEEKSTAFYTEGQPVNSFTSAANNIPSKHYLVCAEDCVLTVGNDSLEAEMCRLIPRLADIIRQEVEKSVGKVQDDLARFIISSPEERYQFLLKTRPELFHRIPQHQIASFLGIKPESLSRLRKRIARRRAMAQK